MINETLKLRLEDKIERHANDSTAKQANFQAWRKRLIELVYDYYTQLVPNFSKDYNLECVEVTDTCISNYQPEKSPFVWYIKSSLRYAMTTQPDSLWKYVRNKINTFGEDALLDDDGPRYVLREIPFSCFERDEDKDDQHDFLETYAPSDISFTNYVDSEHEVRRLFRIMDSELMKAQVRQRPYLGIALTNIAFEAFGSDCIRLGAEDTRFFNRDVFNLCVQLKRPLMKKELALLAGMAASNFNRGCNAFLAKLDERLGEGRAAGLASAA